MLRTPIALAMAILSVILLLPVLVVAAALLAFASAARAIGRLLEPAFVPWTELVEFDRTLGWRPRPNLDAHCLAEHDDVFRMVTDGEGWAGRGTIADSDVVVIGDSFASGYAVDAHRSFAALTSGPRVKAVGAPGYSMVHGVLLMEQLAPRLAGKLVVWFVYPENDLQDNLAPEMRQYRAPFVRLGAAGRGWEIVNRHLEPGKWRSSNSDIRRLFPRMCVPGPFADRAYDASEFLIGRAAAACAGVEARLLVVSIPHPMQLTAAGIAELGVLSGNPARCDERMPDRRILESCRRYGVAMVAAANYLSRRDYKRREGIHWNDRGHRRMATLIRALYAAHTSGTLDQFTAPDAQRQVDQAPLRERTLRSKPI